MTDTPEKPAKSENNNRTAIAAGVGMAIGSAALVAALLYAGRNKIKPKSDKA